MASSVTALIRVRRRVISSEARNRGRTSTSLPARPGACKSALHHPSESAKDGRSLTLWGGNGGRSGSTLVEKRNSLVVATGPGLVQDGRHLGVAGCPGDCLPILSRLCHGDGTLCRVHHGKLGHLRPPSADLAIAARPQNHSMVGRISSGTNFCCGMNSAGSL